MCRYECLGSIVLLFQDIADSLESKKPPLHGYAFHIFAFLLSSMMTFVLKDN